MARYYADHNVSVYTAIELRRAGHDVTTSRQVNQERAADYRQLLTAAQQNRILLTHNESDFTLLHGTWRVWTTAWQITARHSGVLCFPQSRPGREEWSLERAAAQISEFVRSTPAIDGEMYVWRHATGWTRLHV